MDILHRISVIRNCMKLFQWVKKAHRFLPIRDVSPTFSLNRLWLPGDKMKTSYASIVCFKIRHTVIYNKAVSKEFITRKKSKYWYQRIIESI